MNYANFIVRIIEKPDQTLFENNIPVTEVLVKFPQIRLSNSGSIFQLSIWGNLSHDIIKYYKVNDYIMIEGYISLRENLFDTSNLNVDPLIEISAFKIYPFLSR